MAKLLISTGGPFPFDPTFRGQNVVQWHYILSGLAHGRDSRVVSLHQPNYPPSFFQRQEVIAERAFRSSLTIRRKTDLDDAIRNGNWHEYYSADKLMQAIVMGVEAEMIMHYYNARFRDGECMIDAVKTAYGNSFPSSCHYVLHVNPDQLGFTQATYDEWASSDDARLIASRLSKIVESRIFRSLIAVSESAKRMWLDVLGKFGLCDNGLAEQKIKVVPNGTDPDLYKTFSPGIQEQAKKRLGFGSNVEKVVLVMTRPAQSKGIDRIVAILEEFENSRNTDMNGVGFVIALPECGSGTRKFLEKLDNLKRLIAEGRLKVTIDISKLVRNDPVCLHHVNEMLTDVPLPYKDRQYYVPPITYPLTYAADVLLHVPRAEAFGLVVAEGLLSGCAVVTTNAGGIPGVVKNANGQAVLLDAKEMETREAVTAILGAEKVWHVDDKLINQFSTANKIFEVLGA